MRKIIRLGDPTDHGGKVVGSGAPHVKINGIAVALKGDACTCPKRGHDNCTIAEGDPHRQRHSSGLRRPQDELRCRAYRHHRFVHENLSARRGTERVALFRAA